MESQVIFRDRQELQSADNNNLQTFARNSMDHIVSDAIDPGKGYRGFAASKTGATEITLTAGRLYAGGMVYARNEDVVVDLFNLLPLVTQKRIAIVSYGQEVETDIQPRDFLIDAQTGSTEPQSVAMESHRRAEVSTVSGVEGPDPSYPATDAGVTVIAYVLLDTAGVVSIEQWGPTKLPNLRDVANRTTALENWRSQISGQVDTLRTDLSALADRMQAYALKTEVVSLTDQLDELRTEVYAPGSYIYYGTNHFLDDTGSDFAHADFDAEVEEGIRFPQAGSATSALALLNPNNAYVTINSGFVLPKYDHGLRLDLTGYAGETRLAQYTYETVTWRQLTRARTRLRYGGSKRVCTNGAWWRSGQYDSVTGVFRRNGETWEVNPADRANAKINHRWIRVTRFWIDTYEEAYWDVIVNTGTVNGQQVAQTFLNAQDGWLSQVGLYFSRKDSDGDVTVLICETGYGMPDLQRVVSVTTLPVENIEVGAISTGAGLPSLVETQIPITPTYLKAGRRYAIVLATTGDHYVAMSNTDNGVVQGTFFVSTDGAFYAGKLVEDMKMRLYFAKFERTRLSVELTSFELAGGILDMDILAPGTTPPACRVDYEVQVNGAWVAFDSDPNGPDLSGLPALLPARVTLTGTTDLMPGFGTTGSQVIASRPKTSFVWVSDPRSLASPTSSVKIVTDLQHFDETDHDCSVTLLTGAAFDTVETADVVEDVTLPDGTIRRSSTFNVTSVSDYRAKIVGSTVSVASLFLVGELVEYAQS